MRRTVQDVMTREAEALEKMTGTIDGVVAVESRLVWPVGDVDVLPVPPEPAPLQ